MARIGLISVALIVGLGVAGCSAAGSSSPQANAPQSAVGSDSGGAASAGQDVVDSARSVIITGSMQLTVDRPSATADDVAGLVDAAGGRVDGRDETAPAAGDHGSATLTLRIPTDQLDAVIAKLRKLGTVEKVSISSKDVTGDVEDLDARITALQTSVARLTTLMSTAASTADLVTIESELSKREADLESLESQQRGLLDQVDLATITLSLESVAVAKKPGNANFFSGLVAGWNAFVAFVSFLLVAIGALLPWLVFAAAVTAIVLLLVRFFSKRKARRSPLSGD